VGPTASLNIVLRVSLPCWETNTYFPLPILKVTPILMAAPSRHQPAAPRLLGLRVQIWVLSSRGLYDGMITCPEESYRVWCVQVSVIVSGFSGLGVSALAFGTQVRGFKPDRSRLQGEKILSASSFRREVKPWIPCRWFTVRKRSLDVSSKSGFRQN
jgi:hypothetical protein